MPRRTIPRWKATFPKVEPIIEKALKDGKG